MDKLKKLLVGVSTVALLMGPAAMPAFAGAEATCDDVDEDSFCDSEAYDDDDVYVAATNVGSNLTNFDLAMGISGFNEQNDNEDDNELESDDSEAEYETQNFLNATEVVADDSADASNEDITDNSDGDAYAEDNDYVDVGVENTNTDLDNTTISAAISGLNSQNGNDDENRTWAGSSNAFAFSGNAVNSSFVSTGNSAHAKNKRVDEDSFADAEAYDNDDVYVDVENYGTDVDNTTLAAAVSGVNTQDDNEDDNELTTDESGVEVGAMNFVNVTEVVADGSADATNEDITDNSDGDAYAEDNDYVDVGVDNQTTTVNNSSIGVAVSGLNTQNGNDDKNRMSTGRSFSGGSTTNVVNGTQVSY